MSDLVPTRTYYDVREMCHRDVYKHLSMLRKSLLELKLFSKKSLLENTLYWQKEIEKVKLQKDQEWLERISKIEAENKLLKTIIESIKSSEESKGTHENEVDHLSRQMDKKLIHINQLQLALAEQSKVMFELEKSYVLLYRQYSRVRPKENLSRMESSLEKS